MLDHVLGDARLSQFKPELEQFAVDARRTVDVLFFAPQARRSNMDKYRVMQVGCDFIIFAGDVSALKCQTERDAQNVIAVALDLLETPDDGGTC